MRSKPYAYCCAEAGGDPAICDCVNKNHGTAMFTAVCSIPNCRNRTPDAEAFCAAHRSDRKGSHNPHGSTRLGKE